MRLKKKFSISSIILFVVLMLPLGAVNAAGLWSEDLWDDSSTTPTPVLTPAPGQSGSPYTEIWTEAPPIVQPTPSVTPANNVVNTSPSTGTTANTSLLLTFEVPPVNENGTTLVPLRKLFEVLGANVKFEPTTGTIAGAKGDNIILLTLNSNEAYVNGKKVALSVPAKSVNGRTLVPLRFISQALGSDVKFDSATQKVTIDSQYYFYVGKQPSSSSAATTSQSDNKSFVGTWNIWVSGGYTAPDPWTGISTYTKGAGGGTMTIKDDGTFYWDMKTEQYSGNWVTNPNDSEQIILKSSDGWDYTCRFTDNNTIKWYTYGLEYYGTR